MSQYDEAIRIKKTVHAAKVTREDRVRGDLSYPEWAIIDREIRCCLCEMSVLDLVEMVVGKMSMSEMVTGISDDDDVVREYLGFNPFLGKE